jgi:hypothetical protein
MFERCQLLIRIRARLSAGDPYADVKQHKVGDVIALIPYEQEPGREERSNPDWLLLKVTGEDAIEECTSLTTPQLHTDPGSRNRMLQKRGFRLDIHWLRVALDGEFVDWDARTQIQDIPIEIITACKVEVPVLPDPNVAS